MSETTDRELETALNVPFQFGLRAQGHIETIERLLADGKGWPHIGRVIGWDHETAELWYLRDKSQRTDAELIAARSELKELQADVNRLNEMLRQTGYGQGQIDAYAAQCEELEHLRLEIAALEANRLLDRLVQNE